MPTMENREIAIELTQAAVDWLAEARVSVPESPSLAAETVTSMYLEILGRLNREDPEDEDED